MCRITALFDLTIRFPDRCTQIAVRDGVLGSIAPLLQAADSAMEPTDVLVVTDTNVGPLYAESVEVSLSGAGWRVALHQVAPGEGSKSLNGLGAVYESLAQAHVGRDGLVLALGGGVVSDLAGLAAATWMRGIRFAICPTTLEADIDAAIGGKTAINVAAGKNLVGAFHQPIVVAVDPVCLDTLSARDVRAGLAESVKHALITADDFFDWHVSHTDVIGSMDASVRGELIARNIGIKADIVSRDAHEQTGVRMLLNLGHTVGHAIEACCDYRLRHGECVALGTVACVRLSRALGLMEASDVDRVERLLTALGLPIRLDEPIDQARIMAAMGHDKKARGGGVRFVLLKGIGQPVIRDAVPDEAVREAYESLFV